MSSVTNRLVFDPTAASSSSNVGAYVRAGSDGDLIASQTIAAEEWLNVAAALHAGDGTAITQTAGALDVNIGSVVDLDIRDLVYTQDSVTSHQGGTWTIDSITNDVNVTATDLDIRDLTAASDSVESWTHDGTGNAIGSTTGALDVYLTNPIGDIDIDDDLADTAIQNTATPFSTTAVPVVASALADRKWLALANEGNKTGFFGKAGVTIANGYPLHPGEKQVWRIGDSVVAQIIGEASASAEDLRVMELS